MSKTAIFMIPRGSIRRKAVKKVLRKAGLISGVPVTFYNTWVHQKNEHPAFGLRPVRKNGNPLISIIVPAYNTPEAFLRELVYSIISQAYETWELILVNASTTAESRARVNACAPLDKRIRIIEIDNGGISKNTNAGINEAHGEYIAFVDHDDVLDAFALEEVVRSIEKDQAEIVYTDEDKISENSEIFFDPHYKPDWSPDLLTHVNYINHLTVVKKSLLDKVGLLDPSKDGAQDYDLMLRLTDTEAKVCHVPKVLYHWRAAQNSTAQDFSSKTNITEAGQKALKEHFARKHVDVEVMAKTNRPGFYEIRPQTFTNATLIITNFASDALLRLYTELLILHTSDANVRIELIVPEGVVMGKKAKNIEVTTLPSTADYLKSAVQKAKNEILVIVNDIALPQDKDWLERMTSMLRIEHIHSIAPLIVHHGNLIEDGGLVYGAENELTKLFKGYAYMNNQTFFGNTDWVRNVDALSGGFVVTRKETLNPFLQKEGVVDVRLCLKNYTLQATKGTNKLFNTILSDVVLDNHSIRLQHIGEQRSSHFNNNLIDTGKGEGYELYTPESAALNILIRLKEDIIFGEDYEDAIEK